MRKINFFSFLFATVFCAITPAFSDIKMPRIFSNSMVLQRGENVNIWGTSAPSAKIVVSFSGQSVSAVADKNGAWSVKLAPMKESSQCSKMTISENGVVKKTIEDILVGEVWIVGGQSNMAFGLKSMSNSKDIIANANNSLIRYFNQGSTPEMRSLEGFGKNPESDTVKGTSWLVCSPKNAEYSFKAVPYIFARDLAKKLNMPVGVVYTAIPGTRMVSWIPRGDFQKNPAFAVNKKAFEERLKKYDARKAAAKFESDVRTFQARVVKAKKEGKRPPDAWTVSEGLRPWKDSPDKWASPCMLYNIRIAPIKNFTAKGILWYQGESDDYRTEDFATCFEGFVNVWRREFGKSDMPFVFVQLPSYKTERWAEIRLQQQAVVDKLANMFMATTVDTGEKEDIHPKDKLAVGERLAALALSKVYNQKDVRPHGPVFKKADYRKNAVFLEFNTFGNLVAKGDLKGFEVLVDGKWVAAPAKIQGNSVVVSAPNKEANVAGVRYLYKGWAKPDATLFDNANLPAYPFRHLK